MTIQDAVDAAYKAGFRGEALVTIVAIAGAESGWRPDAVGDSGWSHGLWQVYTKAHPQYPAARLKDPAYNAAAAWEISGGGGNFRPWSVYKSGAYKQYLPQARQAVSGVGSTANVDIKATYGNGRIPDAALVPIGVGSHKLAPGAAAAFNRMREAAAAADITFGVTDSYRTYDSQVNLAARKGLYSQGGLAAKPGTSNHGWGTAVDLALSSQAQSWLNANAATYGFKTIPREPWHWEFTGDAGMATNTGWLPDLPSVPDLGGALDALKMVTKAGLWLSDPRNTWRILQVILGSIAMLLGVLIIAKPYVESKVAQVAGAAL